MKTGKLLKKIFRYTLAVLAVVYLLVAGGLLFMEKVFYSGQFNAEAVRGESKAPHTIVLLDRGADSMYNRIKIIREAKQSIELEFFIFDLDESSQIITQEIIKKAEQGLKVRVIVDFSLPVFKLKPAYAKYLMAHGVEVRYYNTAPMYRFISSQHRSHRKLLIVDGFKMITGGRNIANDYFDLGAHYNFIDSDIFVEGEIVKTARSGFDAYFNSDLAAIPDSSSLDQEEDLKTHEFFKQTPQLLSILEKLEQIANKQLQRYICNDITFVTDPPAHGEKNRLVFKELVEISNLAKDEIFIESPYFVLRDGGFEVLKGLRDRGVRLNIITNSLHATDAVYAVGSILIHFFKIKRLNLNLYAMKGRRPAEATDITDTEHWGLHAKRSVIDGRHIVVGTYNIDPRSANLNSELLVICKNNSELAQAVLKSFELRRQSAALVLAEDQSSDPMGMLRGATFSQFVFFALALPFSNMFDFLL